MLTTIANLTLTASLATAWAPLRAEQAVGAPRDSVQAIRGDSTAPAPLASRSRARVGIGTTVDIDDARPESPDTATAQRRRAVEHSDWYYRRLTIHKAASYTTIPLFATEYWLGDKLYRNKGTSSTRSAHQAVATGLGVLFGVNTITGVWNLWDSRHDDQGRARRITHSVLMLASDAGFIATAALAPGGEGGEDFGESNSNNRSAHRSVAIGSMGVSLGSYLMMYLWK